MGSKRKEQAKKLILEDNVTDIKILVEKTGLSKNRIYELRRDCGFGLRDKNKKKRQEEQAKKEATKQDGKKEA